MSSGLEIGPVAMILAIAAYILKRWWDGIGDLHQRRADLYNDFLLRCQRLLDVYSTPFDEVTTKRKWDENFATLSERLPEFMIYASPRARDSFGNYFEKCMTINQKWVGKGGGRIADAFSDSADLVERFNDLTDVFRKDLFSLSPRFHFEQMLHRLGKKATNQQVRKNEIHPLLAP